MKKKGFTLVELLAVIIILAIVIALSTRGFIVIQKRILEGQFKNVSQDILNKAEEYARSTGTTEPIDINVQFLIENGLITPDDKEYIYDPRDRSNVLNCYVIHIVLENGEYVATWNESTEKKCTSEVVRYENEIYCNGEKCKTNEDDWYTGEVTLNINKIENLIGNNSWTLEWSSLNGFYEKQSSDICKSVDCMKVKATATNVLNTTYSALLKVDTGEDEKIYNYSAVVKIDNEKPVAISREIKIDYTKDSELVIDATDISGSGIKGYAIVSKDKSCSDVPLDDFKLSAIKITAKGNYKLCILDNAGNITTDDKDLVINGVSFKDDYDNGGSGSVGKGKDIFYIEDEANYPLLVPSRDGYTFVSWVDGNGDKIYDFKQLDDIDEIEAKWNIIDKEISVDKTDKNTMGTLIPNKINMILVLDVSGSMSGSNLTNLKEVSRTLISNMSFDVGSTVTIISFESTAREVLVAGTNMEEAIQSINSLSADGGTTFSNALYRTNNVINDNFLGNDNNYVIFVSDGKGGDVPESTVENIKKNVQTVYSIGIGTSVSTSGLIKIASPDRYYSSVDGIDSLKEIFSTIQKEIRIQETVKSLNGLINLPGLVVSDENPFILYNGELDKDNNLIPIGTFKSISEMQGILTENNNGYNLDLAKVDRMYKLKGNVANISFKYYFEGDKS